MSKKHKKRTKRYSGEDAKTTGVAGQNKPVLHHFEAKQRSPLGQWTHDHKTVIRYTAIAVGIITFIVVIVIGLIQTFSR